MGCRGGELSGEEVDILATNEAICKHIQTYWKDYTYWADRAVGFCVDNEGDALHTKDVLAMIENAVVGIAHKTGLKAAVKKSELKKEYFVYLVARAVYESPKQCSKAVTRLLETCRGTKP